MYIWVLFQPQFENLPQTVFLLYLYCFMNCSILSNNRVSPNSFSSLQNQKEFLHSVDHSLKILEVL